MHFTLPVAFGTNDNATHFHRELIICVLYISYCTTIVPSHSVPRALYPSLQMQWNEPGVFTHSELRLHSFESVSHSLMSARQLIKPN